MEPFLENAQKIFEVAQTSGDDSPSEFALLIRPDGGLHFMMEMPLSLHAAAIEAGAQSAYLITKSKDGVRVEGRSRGMNCLLQNNNPARHILRDQPLYRINSPVS